MPFCRSANDVANAFATSVGSKALTVKQACCIAVVMEFVGATRGLGFVIQDASSTYDLPLSFAAIIVLGIIGVAGNALLRRARSGLLPWEARGRRATSQGNAGG
jgi:ABC-type nitrate/sulfonate/bicarbonate transport system permease component